MSRFIKIVNAVNKVLKESPDGVQFPEKTNEEEELEPISTDPQAATALPEPKDVVLDAIKYKTLLKALREALYNAAKDDVEKQREISNVDVDSDDTNSLKQSENQLMGFLNQSNTVPDSDNDFPSGSNGE
jgi:hypothetical protein